MANFPKATFEQVVKSPLTWALILVGGLLSFSLQRAFGSDEKRIEDCNRNTEKWYALYTTSESEKDSLIKTVIMKDEAIKQIPMTIDSLLRSKINKPVTQILKHTK